MKKSHDTVPAMSPRRISLRVITAPLYPTLVKQAGTTYNYSTFKRHLNGLLIIAAVLVG